MFLSFIYVAFTLLVPVWAAPHTLVPVKRHSREDSAGTGKFLVTFQDDTDSVRAFGTVSAKARSWGVRLADNSTYTGWGITNGFSAVLTADELRELQGSPDVLDIEEDSTFRILQDITQTNSPWNLGRIDQIGRLENTNTRAQTFSFTFPSQAGRGVDIYIFDTGIRTSHRDFGGRARSLSILDLGNQDRQGHGSHCAGTAAGSTKGVAKEASIINVKVLGDNGTGSNSNIIQALQEAATIAVRSGRPSVFSMSLGGPASAAMNRVVTNIVARGIHVVVAAGNEAADARTTSPGGSPAVISVGAADIQDRIARFSNRGPEVDIFAPGVAITSVDASNDTGFRTLSGTSMACPLVAGAVALLISDEGNVSPAAMRQKLVDRAVRGALSGIPSNTANLLLNI